MAGKLSPSAALKIAELNELGRRIQNVHGLVEQFAAAKTGQEMLAHSVKRAFGQLKMAFMGAGLDALAQQAGSMEIAAGRGGSAQTKVRTLREGVASIRFQVELEQRSIVSADLARQEKEKEAD